MKAIKKGISFGVIAFMWIGMMLLWSSIALLFADTITLKQAAASILAAGIGAAIIAIISCYIIDTYFEAVLSNNYTVVNEPPGRKK